MQRVSEKANRLGQSVSSSSRSAAAKLTSTRAGEAVGRVAEKVQSSAVKKGAGKRGGQGARSSGGHLLWGSWKNYKKVRIGNREYAKIGNRLYTRHAVDRMQPKNLGTPAGGTGAGRDFSPNLVEYVVRTGSRRTVTVNGVKRTIHSSGTAEVVTEKGGKIIVTVNPFRGK